MSRLGPLYRLFLHSIARRGRVVMLGALALVGIAIAFAVRRDDSPDAGAEFINAFALVVVVPVVCLVFGTAALGDLHEDGSLVYLWLKPVPRWQIAVAAFAAVLTVVTPLLGVPLAVAAMVTGSGGDVVGGTIAAVGVGLVAYSGVFVWLGLQIKRALAVGLAYIFIWEGFVARAGDSASRLAIRSYTRSILGRITDTQFELGDVSYPYAVVVPLAVGLLAIGLTVRRLHRVDVA